EPQAVEHLSSTCLLALPIDQPQRTARLSPQKGIFGHAQVGQQIELLIDDADPQLLGGVRARDAYALPAQHDVTTVRDVHASQDLHQGRLPSAVLSNNGVHLTPEAE